MKQIRATDRIESADGLMSYVLEDGSSIELGSPLRIPDTIDDDMLKNAIRAKKAVNDKKTELYGALTQELTPYCARTHALYLEYREAQSTYAFYQSRLDYGLLWGNQQYFPVTWDYSDVNLEAFHRDQVKVTIREEVANEPLVLMREDIVRHTTFGPMYEAPLKALLFFSSVSIDQASGIVIDGDCLKTPGAAMPSASTCAEDYQSAVDGLAITPITEPAVIVDGGEYLYAFSGRDLDRAQKILNAIKNDGDRMRMRVLVPQDNGIIVMAERTGERPDEVRCYSVVDGTSIHLTRSRMDQPGTLLNLVHL